MKNWRIEAIILAVGLSLAGVFVRNGLSEFSSRSRVVTVKGLAEMEVKADKVTWPLTYKVLGNDMVSLYNEIEESNAKIIAFLKSKGVKENEISVNAPEIIDTKAERYNTTVQPYRYNVTTVVTVTSKHVTYDYTSLNDIKPKMIEEATKNARTAAEKFAKDSESSLGSIQRAYQGQFSIENRDPNTPYIKQVRVVTTIDYSLED